MQKGQFFICFRNKRQFG